MKGTFTLSKKGWVAVALVACVLAAFAVSTGQFMVAVVAFSTAGIAAFDSTHVHQGDAGLRALSLSFDTATSKLCSCTE